MYINTGEKIRTLAKVIAVLNIIAAIIVGALIGSEFGSGIGFIIVVLGVLIAWVSQLVLAGFGELVSNSQQILNVLKPESDSKEE